MKKKRIITLLSVAAVCIALLCFPVFADGTVTWSQKADRSSVDVTYSGRVNWLAKGVYPNYVTYYGILGGSDKDLITVSNAATLKIKSGTLGKTILDERIYADHALHTAQKVTTASSINVFWTFDGYSNSYKIE